MATAGRNAPLVPHMRPYAPRRCVEWMGNNPPGKRMYFLRLLRVCMALKTLWCCGNASLLERRSALRAINTLNPSKKYIRKLVGLSPIHSKHRRGAQGLMWGTRGPFPPAAAMAVVVVTPVVFCAKATEKCYENTETSFLLTIILLITLCCTTYCSSRTTNYSAARAWVVLCPEPKPLRSNGPQHIGYPWKALVIVRMIPTLYWGRNIGITKKTRTGCTQHTYDY
jgi:hypothetical protein